MPRLIDKIRAEKGFGMPAYVGAAAQNDWDDYTRMLCKFLDEPDLPVVLIDNVAEYFYVRNDQEDWDLARDFPNMAPPFPIFWSEHRMPTSIFSNKHGVTDCSEFRGYRVGILSIAARPEEVGGDNIPENAHWVIWCDIFLEKPGMAGVLGPYAPIFLAIDSAGALIGTPTLQPFGKLSEYDAEQVRGFTVYLYPHMLAVSFMHCKNVKIQDERVDKPLAKKYHAKTGLWPTKYKTLVIEPLKEILRTQGKSEETGIKHALHICRGHFADYTEGKGLFGKYHGRFWMPAHVKGTKKDTPAPPREIAIKV